MRLEKMRAVRLMQCRREEIKWIDSSMGPEPAEKDYRAVLSRWGLTPSVFAPYRRTIPSAPPLAYIMVKGWNTRPVVGASSWETGGCESPVWNVNRVRGEAVVVLL